VDLVSGTLLHDLAERARSTPAAPAYRQKSRGIWRETGWLLLTERAAALGAALLALGIERGDRVAILSSARIEAVLAQTAAQLIGALPVLMYPGAPEGVVGAQLARHEARVVFCEDQEQTDKVLAQRVRLPLLAALVCIDATGVRAYRQGGIEFFDELLARAGASGGAGFFEQQLALLQSGDAALVLHSLGSTDRQNPVRFSHAALRAQALAAQQRLALDAQDSYVSLSPLAHVCEQQLTVALPVVSGLTVHFCESPRTALADVREIAPTLFMAPPRVWQALHNQCEQRAVRTGGWRAGLYRRGLLALQGGGRASHAWRWLLVRPLLNALGLTRVRQALVIAAQAPVGAAGFFAALGVPLRRAYALSEAGGFVAIGEAGSDDNGALLEGFESRRSEAGELWLRGPATGGWIATGDLAEFDARGRLSCLGRARDGVSLGAAALHPAPIEQRLRASPYVRDAVVLASRASAPVAMVAIDFEMARDWADARGLPYTTYRSLATRPEVVALIEQQVAEVNAQLQAHERIVHTLVLNEDLDAQRGELTALGTTRRHAVRNHHADRLLALHRNRQETPA
jgi:long-chain acyl-CoA synthetase